MRSKCKLQSYKDPEKDVVGLSPHLGHIFLGISHKPSQMYLKVKDMILNKLTACKLFNNYCYIVWEGNYLNLWNIFIYY